MEIIEYTEKSIVVCGDTKLHKDKLKAMGGKWNANFTNKKTGEKFGAWMFPKIKMDIVKNWQLSLSKRPDTPMPSPVSSDKEGKKDEENYETGYDYGYRNGYDDGYRKGYDEACKKRPCDEEALCLS